MRTEREKMLAGELYDPLDAELVQARERARNLCQDLNATREAQSAERRRILCELFAAGGEDVWMQPPFFCDYGSNIRLGSKCFFNFNCIVLDVCRVTVGDRSLGDPIHIHLSRSEGAIQPCGETRLHVGHDIDGLHAHVLAQGGTVLLAPTDQPWGLREIVVQAPGGHRLVLGDRKSVV